MNEKKNNLKNNNKTIKNAQSQIKIYFRLWSVLYKTNGIRQQNYNFQISISVTLNSMIPRIGANFHNVEHTSIHIEQNIKSYVQQLMCQMPI